MREVIEQRESGPKGKNCSGAKGILFRKRERDNYQVNLRGTAAKAISSQK